MTAAPSRPVGAPEVPPPETVPLQPAVVVAAAAFSLSSGLALVLAILSDRSLGLWTSLVVAPAFVGLVGLTVIARRDDQWLFLVRLRTGVVAGALATAAYDVTRTSVEWLGWASTRSLAALPVFGSGLTGLAPSAFWAKAAGWGFHLVNGLGFAVAYVMVAAGRPWPLAVLWGLTLEAMMVALYPGFIGVSVTKEFLSVSIMGHVFYGLVLGRVAERCP